MKSWQRPRIQKFISDRVNVGEESLGVGVSMAHALICVPLAAWSLWDLWCVWAHKEGGASDGMLTDVWWYDVTDASSRAVGFSALYFTFEIAAEIWKWKRAEWLNIVHAVMSFIGYAVLGWWLQRGQHVLCLMLMMELSTPFFNVYKWLDIYYRRAKATQEAVDLSVHLPPGSSDPLKYLYKYRGRAKLVFGVAFVLVRIVAQPILIYVFVLPHILNRWDRSDTGLCITTSLCPHVAHVATLELSLSIALNFTWFAFILKTLLSSRTKKP